MAQSSLRKAVFIFAIVGIIQFFLVISIAIVFYPGGYELNPSAPGYSFVYNSWSDLGRVFAWSGEFNSISRIFFSIAMIGWAMSFPPSIYGLTSFFKGRSEKLKMLGVLFAVICASTLFVEVIFFPADIYPLEHMIFAALGYIPLLGVETIFAFIMITEGNYPNKYGILFLVVATVIVFYFIFNLAILQKMVSITLALATIVVFYDAIQRIKKEEK